MNIIDLDEDSEIGDKGHPNNLNDTQFEIAEIKPLDSHTFDSNPDIEFRVNEKPQKAKDLRSNDIISNLEKLNNDGE